MPRRTGLNNTRAGQVRNQPGTLVRGLIESGLIDFVACTKGSGGDIRYEDKRIDNEVIRRGKSPEKLWHVWSYKNHLW